MPKNNKDVKFDRFDPNISKIRLYNKQLQSSIQLIAGVQFQIVNLNKQMEMTIKLSGQYEVSEVTKIIGHKLGNWKINSVILECVKLRANATILLMGEFLD